MFTKKGEATLTVLILGVLAVSLISAFSNSYTGYQTASSEFTCSDTDPEDNVFILGTVTGRNETGEYSFQDACGWQRQFSSLYTFERKCINNQPATEQVLCRSPSGVCSNGICIDDIVTPMCTDTDGDNIFIKGNVTGVAANGQFLTYIDSCSSIPNEVYERLCDGVYVSHYNPRKCPTGYGCKDGACISAPTPTNPTCTMSVNPTTVIRGGNTTLRWNSTDATTFYLDGESRILNGATPRSGLNQTTTYLGEARGPGGTSTCQTTVTVTRQLPTCSDTDPNNDVYIKGEVKASGVGYAYLLADVCSGSKNVKERYCGADKKPRDLIKTCPNNKNCIQAKGICQK